MNTRMRLDEVLTVCGVSYEYLIHIIDEEWVDPVENDYFDHEDAARIQLIRELRDEFGVNDEGIPIILHLIDELNQLRILVQKMQDE